jgi:CheY-like chemotaxis protein
VSRPLPPDYPPVLYIPCVRQVVDPADLDVRIRTTKDGRTALLVYSALDRLTTCCGADQPWFVLPTAKLQVLHDAAPFDLVLLDLMVPEHERESALR